MPSGRDTRARTVLGPVVEKFRVWLGLIIGPLYGGMLMAVGLAFFLSGGYLIFVVHLVLTYIVVRDSVFPSIIVHERGVRILAIIRYRAISWDTIAEIKVGPATVVAYRDGSTSRFYTGALADDYDRVRLGALIRRLAPGISVVSAAEGESPGRRKSVDALAAVLMVTSFLLCLIATLYMSARLDTSPVALVAAWAGFLGALAVAGVNEGKAPQRRISAVSLCLSGLALAYYITRFH